MYIFTDMHNITVKCLWTSTDKSPADLITSSGITTEIVTMTFKVKIGDRTMK